MKITCQSCQSKYNVADEKVQGKIVKIRCRKCGATIVVNGTGGAAANGRGRRDGAAGRPPARATVRSGTSTWATTTSARMTMRRAGRRVQRGRRDAGDVHLDRRDGRLAAAGRGRGGRRARCTRAPGRSRSGRPARSSRRRPPRTKRRRMPRPRTRRRRAAELAAGLRACRAACAAAYARPRPSRSARRSPSARRARGTSSRRTRARSCRRARPWRPQAMAPAAGGDGLTGQRNENSVLFSLAVLTKNAEDARPERAEHGEQGGLGAHRPQGARREGRVDAPGGDAPTTACFTRRSAYAPPARRSGRRPGELGRRTRSRRASCRSTSAGAAGVLVLLVLGIVIGVKIAGSAPAARRRRAVATAPADGDRRAARHGVGRAAADASRERRAVGDGRGHRAEEVGGGGGGVASARLRRRRRRAAAGAAAAARRHRPPRAGAEEGRRRLRLQRRPDVPHEVLDALTRERESTGSRSRGPGRDAS